MKEGKVEVDVCPRCPYCGELNDDHSIEVEALHNGFIGTFFPLLSWCNSCHKDFAIEAVATVHVVSYKLSKYDVAPPSKPILRQVAYVNRPILDLSTPPTSSAAPAHPPDPQT